MKLLVTGADGFTGLHFLRLARAAGQEVAELRSDLTQAAAVRDEVLAVRPDAVLHLAGISFVGHADAGLIYQVNLLGTLHLLEALAALAQQGSPPRRVVLASSANVYGNAAGSPIGEDQPAAPLSHYAVSKLAMEHMARTYAARLPIMVARPFNYTGPGQAPSFVIPKLVDHFARRAPFVELGNLDVEREFNDVRFVCEAYLRLLAQVGPGETCNICTGRPVSLRQVIGLLSEMTAHTLRVQVNPALVRANEIHRLCGDPARLTAAIGPLAPPPLQDTLGWMLREHEPAPCEART